MKYTTGALNNKEIKDTRNYSDKELATSSCIKWGQIDRKNTKHYGVFNQGRVGACVACSIAKIKEIKTFLISNLKVVFDPFFIYLQRKNSTPGMGANDACKIGKNGNFPLVDNKKPETENESHNLYKFFNFNMVEAGGCFTLGEYMWLNAKDIDAIAKTIDSQGAVMVWFSFGSNNKWWSEKPIIAKNSKPYHHSVVAVDYGIEDGKRCLVIEDSSGPETGFNGNQRIITEEFLKENCYVAIVFADRLTVENEIDRTDSKPFEYDLEIGDRDVEVRRLQDTLQGFEYFPNNMNTTDYYGPITKKAVIEFQIHRNVINHSGSAGAGRFGPKTRAELNELIKSR